MAHDEITHDLLRQVLGELGEIRKALASPAPAPAEPNRIVTGEAAASTAPRKPAKRS